MNTTNTALNVIFLGTAGSGKTTMVHRFGHWLELTCHYKVRYVNLDPACLEIPFSPDFDIRSMFTTKEIMERERLGPNAAIIRCSDLMSERAGKIARSIGVLEGDVRLIDSPGQTEIFVFRESGPRIARALTSNGYTVSVMLFDKTLASTPIDVATAQLMTLVVQLRIGVPMITAMSKADLLPNSDIDKLLSDQSLLIKAIEKQSKEGVYRDLSLEISSLIRGFKLPMRIVNTSAMTGTGFSELLDIINETLCACGDLT
nr:ATP/GTP-binding protein [Candidatus Njordarchaeum guaymaensis]